MEIKCPKCNEDIAKSFSGTISCVNDNCDLEVIGIIYPKPITWDLNATIMNKVRGLIPTILEDILIEKKMHVNKGELERVQALLDYFREQLDDSQIALIEHLMPLQGFRIRGCEFTSEPSLRQERNIITFEFGFGNTKGEVAIRF